MIPRIHQFRIPDGRMAFGDVPEHIDQRLQDAVKSRHADPQACERLLWEAHAMGPKVLPVYLALYKFYFHQQNPAEAERVCLIGLTQAAAQGGFVADWRRLDAASTDWAASGPARFYLFTLKAISFIRLRRQDLAGALETLDKLDELDPQDLVGHGVVRALANRVRQDDDAHGVE